MSLLAWLVSLMGALIVIFGLAYSSTLYVKGLRMARRESDEVDSGPLGYRFYFLVAARNEEAVIGRTVQALLQQLDSAGARGTVIVIDDHSEDSTATVVDEVHDDRVLLVKRRLPEARKGKGPALNHGFKVATALAAERMEDLDSVLIGVMDADGRLSEGALRHVSQCFADPSVGGVQLGVRIRNRERLLTRVQDYEFWGASAVAQYGRSTLGSVSLGGNGQFSRQSALVSLGAEPWSGSLTEDLDLTVSLHTRGWITRSTARAFVDQEGLESVRALIRQRTRWMQGHMMTAHRVPELWKSTRATNTVALESSAYILTPWLLTLPWSILFHVSALAAIHNTAHLVSNSTQESGVVAGGGLAVLVYLVTFFPVLTGAFLYLRQARGSVSFPRALLVAHAHLLFQYITYISTWNALYRMIRRRTDWQKTLRVERTNIVSPSQPERREYTECTTDQAPPCRQLV